MMTKNLPLGPKKLIAEVAELGAARKSDDDDDDNNSEITRGPPLGPEDGTPKQLAADSEKNHKESFAWRKNRDRFGNLVCRPDTQDVSTKYQAKADRVYGFHGMSADKPLHGESLISYRRRLLNPFKHMSPAFKISDLRVLAVDAAGFEAAEATIYADAESEGRNPTNVPIGILRRAHRIPWRPYLHEVLRASDHVDELFRSTRKARPENGRAQ
jgi:hypothetical protein